MLTSLAAGISAGELSAYIAILVFLLTLAGGVVTYLIRRRATTGTVNTSEASVLWDQAQKMRSELTAQLDRVTAQRDRIIESQSSQVLPVLSLVSESLKQITQSLAHLEAALARLEESQASL